GAVALGQHVVNASKLQHRSHRTTGDNAGTLRGGLHVNLRSAVASLDRVMNRVAIQVDLNHVAARRLHRFLDSCRHLACLTAAEAHFALAVADNGQSGEAENTTTLDHFRNPIDLYQFFLVAVTRLALFISISAFLFVLRHRFKPLEFQAAFAGCVSQSFHTAVIFKAAAIKSNSGNASCFRALGDQFANACSGSNVAGRATAQRLIQRGRTHQHTIAFRRDDLRVDMLRSAVNTQTVYTQLVDLDAGAACTAKSRFSFGCAHDLALLLLGFFTKHVFIGVANAFAFVRLWRTE